jgi:hypothetical protein
MPLRLFRGRVIVGRENEFIDLMRQGVEREAPDAPGLISFMCGYRREAGADRFLLASAWNSEAELRASIGQDPLGHPNTLDKLAGVAEAEQIEHFELLRPLPAGILDAPGAVIRASRAVVRPGRLEALLDFLVRKEREVDAGKLLLGWMIGWRQHGERTEWAGVSAWPSPLQYEVVADTGLADSMLFAELDELVTDFQLEVYQAIELQLPERLVRLGGRRLIVARFDSTDAAANARDVLARHLAGGIGSDGSVARLASRQADAQVFVARVMMADHAAAERLIADHGGQILYEADEAQPAARLAPRLSQP